MSILGKFKKQVPVLDKPKGDGAKMSVGHYNFSAIKKPWITEKTTELVKLGKYVFIVPLRLASHEIKKAVEIIYSVKVVSVNIINIKPRKRRLGRSMGKVSGHRKAIVTLKEG